MGEPSSSTTAQAKTQTRRRSTLSTNDPTSPVSLLIRFAISLPDLPIYVPAAANTSVSTLKSHIRSLLPPDQAKRRLRLIHAGKVLSDSTTLGSQLQVSAAAPPPPPLSSSSSNQDEEDKRKGKGKDVDPGGGGRGEDLQRAVYIHCSVGDELSEEDLAKEANEQEPPTQSTPQMSTLPQPRGFDRLLSAGFSESDVAALRSQFNRLHGDDEENVRMLEDRWIDESAGQGGELADGSPAGSYEDMFLGATIGFFWPVAVFLMREEEVFSKRMQMSILAGVLVNLAFCVLRYSSA
ncbi:hypothetical protein L873DRAFT_1795148 [Choiromyces venosus 120613-1]|uniref:Ubiquitin-like domain-containing protein n=1 Tax=Choiromyces venosus 120613-1 TaxID=1336337 RepID=A0A3N4IXU7_9PEZI|nr:hypothetical protein L873DRAFT_1795148 [Choiromyces venosus 120613-1]